MYYTDITTEQPCVECRKRLLYVTNTHYYEADGFLSKEALVESIKIGKAELLGSEVRGVVCHVCRDALGMNSDPNVIDKSLLDDLVSEVFRDP